MVIVVIPALNEASHIEAVIESLSTGLPENREIRFVVADGGSTDGTAAIVQRIGARRADVCLVDNHERLQSAGINLVVEIFGNEADIMVRCDAHCKYPTGYVASLLETLEGTGADSVVVPMDTIGETCFQRAVAWVSDTAMGSGGSAHRAGRKSGFVDHGHHAAFRIASFRAAGGYDPTYSHNEDAEFDCRLGRIGGRIYLTADLRIGYLPRQRLFSLARQYFNYGRGRSRTVRRHPGSMRLRQLAVPSHCALLVLTLLAGLFVTPIFLLYAAAYIGALLVGAGVIARQRRSLCGLFAAPAALTMHMSWAWGFFVGLLTVREQAWQPIGRRLDTTNAVGRRT